MSDKPKKLWRVRFQKIQVREVDVEADSQDEAERLVGNAEFDEKDSEMLTTEYDYAEAEEIK